LTASAVRGGT